MPSRKRDRSVLQRFADEWLHCEASLYLTCGSHRLEIHHVLGGAHRIDKFWNLVRLCGNCHDWVHHRPQAGKILCWYILESRGAFEPDTIREAWQKCPLGVIEVALPTIQEDWIRTMGEELLRKYA